MVALQYVVAAKSKRRLKYCAYSFLLGKGVDNGSKSLEKL